MASNTQVSLTVVNQQADALARRLDSGYFKIYDGDQPLSADNPITTQNEIASLSFGIVSAPPAVDGAIIFNILPNIANQDGEMKWYRCYESDEVTVVMDGNIGLTDENVIFYTIDVLSGQQIEVNLQHTVGKDNV